MLARRVEAAASANTARTIRRMLVASVDFDIDASRPISYTYRV
jgi:hypothetical protein